MNWLKSLFLDEPVATVGVVKALLALLVAFGLRWTPEQVALTIVFLEVFFGWLARKASTPNTRVLDPASVTVRDVR